MDDFFGGNLFVLMEFCLWGDVVLFGWCFWLVVKVGVVVGRDGSGVVGGDGVVECKLGILCVVCKLGIGIGVIVFCVIELVLSLGNCLGVLFVKFGDGFLDIGNGVFLFGFGEDVGDIGEMKVVSIGVFIFFF